MSSKQKNPKYTWYENRYYSWWLLAPDGEIIDKLYKSLGGGWTVESTGKEYASLGKAKTAVEINYEIKN